jgi:thiol-disulfide isomerase/thioredoxin
MPATITLTTLCVVNLILLLGLVRRVNRLGERSGAPAAESPEPAVGDRVGQFAATTTGGERIDTAGLTGRTLVGFFAAGCPPCERLLPHFVANAEGFPGGRRQVLAIVVAKKGDPGEVAARLERIARVIVEPGRGPASRAFGVDAFPSVCQTENGRIVATNFEPVHKPAGQLVDTPIAAN